MRAELRADGLHISGYVNVPGRESRPVMTPHGRVIEIIEQRAFQKTSTYKEPHVLIYISYPKCQGWGWTTTTLKQKVK